MHRVGDAWPVRVVRLGREPHRLGVIVLAAAPGHNAVGQFAVGRGPAAAVMSDGRRRRVAAARVRPVVVRRSHHDRRVRPPGVRHRGARVLMAERLVQFGRVVQQPLHEHFLLGIVARPAVPAAARAQLARAGPAAGQRPVPVVRGHRRQVLGAAADAAHDVRALQRRRRLLQPVQRADRPPRMVPRIGLHVEALAAQQRRFGERPRRLDRPVGERHVDHASRVGRRSVQPAVIVFARRVHLKKRKIR